MNHPLYHIIRDKLENLVDEHNKVIVKTDSRNTSSIWALAYEVVGELVRVAEEIPVPSFVKKLFVLAAADTFYDLVIAQTDIPFVPRFVVKPTIHRVFKMFYLLAISALIDYTVSKMGE